MSTPPLPSAVAPSADFPWKKLLALGFLLFMGLWGIGFVRTFREPYAPPPPLQLPSLEYPSSSSRLALANNLQQLGLGKQPLPKVLEQPDVDLIRVFEKSGQLMVGTSAFAEDDALIRSALAANKAMIFNEKNTGIAPARRLTLEVGVHPDKFDGLLEQLRQIGRLESINVEQKDRTSEFRQLNAKRQALKTHHESVLKLREGKSASQDDAVKLEQKIYEIEKELQGLSVQLGDLVGRESYYHIFLTLTEFQPGSRLDRTYTVAQRTADGWLWAVAWWFVVVFALGLATATFYSVRTLWPRRSATKP